jgi:sugar phosphate isomerase/epimerase
VRLDQIAVSPCSNPEMGLEEVMGAYAALGYRHFEAFTSWVQSAFDPGRDPQFYLGVARCHGMTFCSLHLPPVRAARVDRTLVEAVAAARFAAAIGVEVVLYKAEDRPTYVRAAAAFLDAVEPLGITPVIQNHWGTALTTLQDVSEVLAGIGDPRMRTLLEVGHFHSAGVGWREALARLGDTVALVHVKDQVGAQSVPFGQGEIDLRGLFRAMDGRGYRGRYVVEMEVRDRENTLDYLAAAYAYMQDYCEEGE